MASIQKRGASWRAVIRRTGHTTQIKTFPTKHAAEAWARKIEREMDAAEFVDHRSYKETARTLLERYRDEVTPRKKGARWERTRLNMLMRAAMMDKPVNKITRQDVVAWRDSRGVSGPSVRREMVLLSSVFNYAKEEWGLPVVNPIKGVPMPADSKARERRPSTAELGAIRSHFEKKRMGLLVEFAIETAMRLGEICALKPEHIHIEQRYAHIVDSKNGEARKVPLSSKALEVIEKLRPYIHSKDVTIFGIKASSAGVYWREACKKLGIEDLHFHDLRHEAATRMANKLHVLELARVTGHKDLKQLQRYYNPKPDELASKLD